MFFHGGFISYDKSDEISQEPETITIKMKLNGEMWAKLIEIQEQGNE